MDKLKYNHVDERSLASSRVMNEALAKIDELVDWANGGYDHSRYALCTTLGEVQCKDIILDDFVPTASGWPQDGCRICVRFEYGNKAASPTLRINTPLTYDSPILYKGKPVRSASIKEHDVLEMVYDEGAWQIVGSLDNTIYWDE